MNIFVLDKDPIKAARMLCDKHVVKMPTESAQILCQAFHAYSEDLDPPYGVTHFNNRYCLWARASFGNFNWLLKYALEMTEEHKRRYNKEDYHKARTALLWCQRHKHEIIFPRTKRTTFVQPTKEFCHLPDPVDSYRKLYLVEKRSFATWKNTKKPYWWKEDEQS